MLDLLDLLDCLNEFFFENKNILLRLLRVLKLNLSSFKQSKLIQAKLSTLEFS
jgi:hypothetical protein